MNFKNVFIFFLIGLFFSCGKSKDIRQEEKPEIEEPVPDPMGSFDYSKITEHPRLLLKKGEEEEIKLRIASDPDLKKVHDHIIAYCEKLMGTSLLKHELEGKRLLAVSRNALKRIFYLSYAYRMTGNELYSIRAETEMLNVCSFPDWNPSHYLDVGEMALAVSIGYDWLFDNLQASSKEKIEKALISKAIATSKEGKYNSWLTRNDNWNQVCNTGILYAALAIYEKEKVQSVEMIERYLQTIVKPLEIYSPNGNYPEGYGYWAYGTGFQVLSLAALESAFDSDQNLSQSPGFLNTAQYLLYMTGPTGLSFNYSDSDSKQVPNPFMFWFAGKSNETSLLYTEIQLLKDGLYLKSSLEDRLLPVTLVFGKDIDLSSVVQPDSKVWIGKGANPIAIVRTDWEDKQSLYLGIKGGKASNNHGHMDAGSFVFEERGVRWAIDLGLQSYYTLESKGVDLWNMSQNSQRWEVFRLNNFAHNTLTVSNNLHTVGGNATFIEEFTNGNKLGAKLNMTPVFGNDLKEATREITVINESYLQILDELSAGTNGALISWRMCTSADARIIDDHTIELTKDDKKLHLIVDSPANVTMKTWTNVPPNSFDLENPGTSRVGFEISLLANQSEMLKVRLIPYYQ